MFNKKLKMILMNKTNILDLYESVKNLERLVGDKGVTSPVRDKEPSGIFYNLEELLKRITFLEKELGLTYIDSCTEDLPYYKKYGKTKGEKTKNTRTK